MRRPALPGRMLGWGWAHGRAPDRAPGRVAVVTDSTAALPPALARAAGVRVVSLDVVVGGRRTLDGDLGSADLLAALERGERPVTSQPPPAAFAAAYERAAAEGASAVVSVHLSGAMSGTVGAARAAAASVSLPVVVVDSGTVAMGLGFAALAAARAGTPPVSQEPASAPWWRRWRDRLPTGTPHPAPQPPAGDGPSAQPEPAAGSIEGPPVSRPSARDDEVVGHRVPDVADVAATAQAVAASSSVWFLADSLDHLRRGGRLSGTSALLGTILQLRPLLTVADGRIAVVGKVRTRRAARARLVQLAVESVLARPQARLAVHHLGNPDAAAELAGQVVAATGDRVVETVVTEAGAVLAAHVGPGALAVAVADAQPCAVGAADLGRPATGTDRPHRPVPSLAPWSVAWRFARPAVPRDASDEPSTAQADDGSIPGSAG